MFLASYEDATQTEARARENGWTENAGSFFDFDIDPMDCPRTAKRFADLKAAMDWTAAAIASGKTVFGVGEVVEIKELPRAERCRYCVCQGEQRLRRWILDSSASCNEETILSDCHD